MAAWAAAPGAEHGASPRPRPRRPPAARAKRERRVTVGVVWIGALATLLAGVVALNVAVLRLNMRLDRLSHERTGLQADNAALTSQLSSTMAAGRIQKLAMHRLGFVQASPDQTTFVRLQR
jgi:cell division protein FtsL